LGLSVVTHDAGILALALVATVAAIDRIEKKSKNIIPILDDVQNQETLEMELKNK
jgi:NADH:ubiquinone oxidoreductase subunit E